MLLELLRWLFPGFGLFEFITMRAIVGAGTALALSLWMGPFVIERLRALKSGGQPIRTDGPQSHFSKAGTPTMGGALILLAVTLSTLLWSDLSNRYVWIALAVMLSFALIGWLDD
ncbi:MAG: phospho-N-acetylmuramoyl-pentapeptide-transferase, partial [Silanimonas sp.]